MKSLLFLSFLIATKVFAVDVCSFSETWEFEEELENQNIKPIRVIENHKKFTSVDKKLIHKTVTLQSYHANNTIEQSIANFLDLDEEGKSGNNAGNLTFYNIDGKQLILVRYWPWENEYGAFYSINKNGSFKLVAVINDSFIECK
jgi:phosphoribosylformylglycinamidine (FGAM) synthase-like amidotransferase family enzyme